MERVKKNIYKHPGSSNLWISFSHRGNRRWENTGTHLIKEAQALLDIRRGEARSGKLPDSSAEKTTFEDLKDGLLRHYRIKGRKSIDRAETSCKKLEGFFGKILASEITDEKIEKYIEWRQGQTSCRKKPPSNGTINRELMGLKTMFNLALKARPPKVNGIPNIPLLKENKPRSGFFERDEFLALRGALPDHLKPYVTAAYWTGMRSSELKSLRWDQIDLETGRMELFDSKNGDGRIVYMPRELWECLKAQRDATQRYHPDCPWVFHRHGEQINRYNRVWKRVTREVGLEGRLFHDFRRTGVRNLIRAGVTEDVAMKISGHRTRQIFSRYNITNERDVLEAARRMDAFLKCGGSVAQGDIVEEAQRIANREKTATI